MLIQLYESQFQISKLSQSLCLAEVQGGVFSQTESFLVSCQSMENRPLKKINNIEWMATTILGKFGGFKVVIDVFRLLFLGIA